MEFTLLVGVVAGIAFVLAGLVKGVIGMGLPTVVVGIVSLVASPAHAAALLMLPSLATNTWQAASGPHLAAMARRLAGLLVACSLGIATGSGWLKPDAGRWAVAVLGTLLLLYAIVCLAKVQFRVPRRIEWWLGPVVGYLTGLVTAATGIFVLPAVPYIQALEVDRDELVQGLGLSFATASIMLTASLTYTGVMTGAIAGASLAAIVPAIAGMVLGQRIRRRISATAFRKWFFVGLLVLGATLAARPLVGL